jgi:Flp pilus assembly protein TadD
MSPSYPRAASSFFGGWALTKKSKIWIAVTGAAWAAVSSSTLIAVTPSLARGQPIDGSTEQIHDRAAQALVQGRLLEALQGFNEVLEREPFNASAYYNRGNVRHLRREFELALEDFTSAIKYRPGFAAAFMNRGVVNSNLSRLDDALSDLDKAAEFDPSNPDVFFNRAIVQVKRDAMESALSDYEKIVQLDGSVAGVAQARLRLSALLTQVDELAVVGRERTRRIVAEIDHARSVEAVLAFAERTCIRLGDDHQALVNVAQLDGWTSATAAQLARGSTANHKLTAGWMATNNLGSIAIVQSQSVPEPHLVSCSITAKLGDQHWFEDLATLFSSKFGAPSLVIREFDDKRVSQQVVVREDQARVEVILQQTTAGNLVTVGTRHSRESTRDAAK